MAKVDSTYNATQSLLNTVDSAIINNINTKKGLAIVDLTSKINTWKTSVKNSLASKQTNIITTVKTD